MPDTYRHALLSIQARLDQMQTDAERILAEPVYADLSARAEELRELLVDMQAILEEKLDRLE